MKAILIGLGALFCCALDMVLLQDLTVSVFFLPVGIGLIYRGIRYGAEALDDLY